MKQGACPTTGHPHDLKLQGKFLGKWAIVNEPNLAGHEETRYKCADCEFAIAIQ